VLTSPVLLLLGGGSIGILPLFCSPPGDCGNVFTLDGNLGAKSSRVLEGLSDRSIDGFFGTGGAGLRGMVF
jgi:hypothetical protein